MNRAIPQRPVHTTAAAKGNGAMSLAIFALLSMVMIGLNPLSDKVKTIPFTGEGDIARQAVYAGIFLWVVFFSGIHRDPKKLLALPLSMSVVLIYCWISLLWSLDPSVGARRLGLTTIIVWTAFSAVSQNGYEQSITMARIALVLCLFLSYVAVVVSPVGVHTAADQGDMGLVGDWRGVLPQKNFAGAVCAFTVLFFFFDARKIAMGMRAGIILAALFFLYKSNSKTSIGILAIVLFLGCAYLVYNPRFRLYVIFGIFFTLTIVALFMYTNWDMIMKPFSDEDALTGRVQIWPVLIDYAKDHWWFGTGYGSFWNIGDNSPVFYYSKKSSWVQGLGNGHNGYFDMLTQVGFPGLVLVVSLVLLVPVGVLIWNRRLNRSRGALLLATLIFCICHNTTETSLLDRDAIVETFLMLTIALIWTCTNEKSSPATARPYISPAVQTAPELRRLRKA